jgi:hypothetical protein
METFIFPVIMRASRTGDKSKVMNLGPYTLVLSEIINHTAGERKDIQVFNHENPVNIFRGCALPNRQIEKFIQY